MKMKMKSGGDIMVFRESPMNPTSVLYLLLYYLLSYTLYTITRNQRLDLTACGLPLEFSCTARPCVVYHATYTHHHTILYTHIVYPIHPQSRSWKGRFSGQNTVSSGICVLNYGRRSKPRFMRRVRVFRAQTFGLILSYII
jgi:hypothetical protein